VIDTTNTGWIIPNADCRGDSGVLQDAYEVIYEICHCNSGIVQLSGRSETGKVGDEDVVISLELMSEMQVTCGNLYKGFATPNSSI
jgi:hypothetical protein